MSVAGGLPDDLVIRLTDDGAEQEVTMAVIAQDPFTCWFGRADQPSINQEAGPNGYPRVSCNWGDGGTGVFHASSAGFQIAEVTLHSVKQCDDCCEPWTVDVADVKVGPM
jgi:hypothetical protein